MIQKTKKYKKISLLFALLASLLAQQGSFSAEKLPAVPIISDHIIHLDEKERYAVDLAKKWKNNPEKPHVGKDGSVTYLFGVTLPTLVCNPLKVCSIHLQEGEIINDTHEGDKARWEISPTVTGTESHLKTILVVKPHDAGLESNLIITTDRRIYIIKLISSKEDWMPSLSFDYPDDIQEKWNTYYKKIQKSYQDNTLSTGQNIDTLDFNYTIRGTNVSWKPIRVYTDGIKTYIQFRSSHFQEAPVLFVLDTKWDKEIVNYRLIGDRYVVDKVFNHASLITGVGRNQKKIDIKKDI